MTEIKRFNCLRKIAFIVAIASTSIPVTVGASAGCIDDWAKAGDIARKRQLVPLAELSRVAPDRFNGRIVIAHLCERDEIYFYRLVIRDEAGRFRRLEVDPRSGQASSASAKD